MSEGNASFDTKLDSIQRKLTTIHTDVEIIKNTCETRGKTCRRQIVALDSLLRGNGGGEGLMSKVRGLEKISSGKEKFAFFVIGTLVTGVVSLLLILIAKALGE